MCLTLPTHAQALPRAVAAAAAAGAARHVEGVIAVGEGLLQEVGSAQESVCVCICTLVFCGL